MKVLHPAAGAHLPVSHPVRFDGTADEPSITHVHFVADTATDLGTALVSEDHRWTFVRQFSKMGVRQITAIGLNAAEKEVARTTTTIDLQLSSNFGYTPPEKTLAHLGDIAGLLEIAEKINKTFATLDHVDGIFKLPGDILYFESNLDLDTDGKRSPSIIYDATHQDQTSLRYPNGESLDANAIPFFVLPGLHSGVSLKQVSLGGMVFSLGDIAAVLYQNKIEFAVFADFGPTGKIGEGSIALHRALGHETVMLNKHILDADIETDVVTLVFPGSGNGTPQTADAIRKKGRELFIALGGNVP